ncbi:MAG: hypothetical protein D6820_03310 [Lentisphaerae bacterium]|nr:MAG: hypothetical protein D6820_03310 [Lentisphaerota bacterium]
MPEDAEGTPALRARPHHLKQGFEMLVRKDNNPSGLSSDESFAPTRLKAKPYSWVGTDHPAKNPQLWNQITP